VNLLSGFGMNQPWLWAVFPSCGRSATSNRPAIMAGPHYDRTADSPKELKAIPRFAEGSSAKDGVPDCWTLINGKARVCYEPTVETQVKVFGSEAGIFSPGSANAEMPQKSSMPKAGRGPRNRRP
jgi:hypothetical protein